MDSTGGISRARREPGTGGDPAPLQKQHYEPPKITNKVEAASALICVARADQLRALMGEVQAHGSGRVSVAADFLVLAGSDGRGVAPERASTPAPRGNGQREKRAHLVFAATVVFMALEDDLDTCADEEPEAPHEESRAPCAH